MYGQAVGTLLFGLIALVVLRKHISDIAKGHEPEMEEDLPATCVNTQPFCTHDALVIDDASLVTDEATK
ncbi:multidrug and toxin extrusion (MATE) family efflux pump YdhE/NorM homolog [Vibrio astriarenae]|nr:multidrug and toxin extrusion (MATE) family efflux pump YdhE/NorM homolog [Vibrio sp. C7]